jgi:hypothetical protein
MQRMPNGAPAAAERRPTAERDAKIDGLMSGRRVRMALSFLPSIIDLSSAS